MPKRLLVIDANLAVQKLMEFILQKEGFEVSPVGDALSGLDTAIQAPPDLIILDAQMTGLPLNLFLQKLRNRPALQAIPLVALVSGEAQAAALKEMGIHGTVTKPIDALRLLESVRRLVAPGTAPVSATSPAAASAPPASPTAATPVAPVPAGTPAAARPTPPPEETEDMLKIEELLGWGSAPPPAETTPSTATARIPAAPEPSPRASSAAPPPAEPRPALKPGARPADRPDDRIVLEDQDPQEVLMALGVETPRPPANLEVSLPPPAPIKMSGGAEDNRGESAIDPTRPVSQTPSPQPAAAQASPQAVEEAVARLAKEMLERIAWEVVPELAQIAIEKEIERLRNQQPTP